MGAASIEQRFERWVEVVAALPRKQTRVLTWPLVTVFGFIAQPDTHLFLKPNVTRAGRARIRLRLRLCLAAGVADLSKPARLRRTVRRDLRDWRPRDMIDIQSFIWVQGSDEYD